MTLDTNNAAAPAHAPESGVVIEVHGAQMPVSFSPVRLTKTKESLIDSVIHAEGIFFSPGRGPETSK